MGDKSEQQSVIVSSCGVTGVPLFAFWLCMPLVFSMLAGLMMDCTVGAVIERRTPRPSQII